MTILPPKPLKQSKRQVTSTHWYRETENVHKHVFASLNALSASRNTRERNNAKFLSFYENVDTYVPGVLRPIQDAFNSKLTYNVIKSCIDSAASKIAKNKPKPEFVTNNADHRLKRKANNLTQYIEGVYYDNDLYDIAQDAFVDACLTGTGCIQIWSDGERIRYDRVDIDEILVDDCEGVMRKPKQLFHVRKVFRDALLERFRDDKEATEAITKTPSCERSSDSVADLIEVAEAWYLPRKTSEGVEGGRHVVALENVTLLDEEYKKDYFPFAFFRWNNRRKSFYGQGLAEELTPIQLKIARLVQHIDRNMKHTGLRVFLPYGSEINPNHLVDERNPITTFDPIGGQPVVATYPAVAAEVYRWLEQLKKDAYEQTGINQMTAFAQKAPGIDSGIALQTLADTQTERFMLAGQRWEKFLGVDIAKITVDLSRDLYEENPKLAVKSASSGFLATISWKEADLDEDKYKLQCFAVSSFASSPAARLQQTIDMMKMGVLSKRRALDLLGQNPDLKEFITSDTASLIRVQKCLELMKYDGEYTPPDSFLDLDEAIEEATAEINRSIVENVEQDNIQLMRDFVSACQAEKKRQAALNAPPPAANENQLAPQAQPQQVPTTDMLPMTA